jgi:hypothetical protein
MPHGPTFAAHSLKHLLGLTDAGQFAVPRLQRAFVWNGQKASALVDSILRGLPIGALTVWTTSRRNHGLLPNSHHILPEFNGRNPTVWYLLDGQQRLSVLHHIRHGSQQRNARRQTVDFGRICLRLTPAKGDARIAEYRKPVDGQWYPIHYVVSPQWRKRCKGLGVNKRRLIAKTRKQLLSSKVPVVSVRTDSVEEARLLFIRINSLGTPLAAADRAFARAATLDLRGLAYQAWEHKLTEPFKSLSYEMLLQAMALVNEIDEVGERAFGQVIRTLESQAAEPRGKKLFLRHWTLFLRAFLRALDELRKHYGVLTQRLLPSDYMVATLTVFFFSHRTAPNAFQRKQIDAWFWATGVGQRYSGRGFRTNIKADADYFRQLARGKSGQFPVVERIDSDELTRASYSRNSSIGNTFYCLLVIRQPRDLISLNPVSLEGEVSPTSARHRHHVYPRALLARKKIPRAKANSVLNLILLEGGANSGIGTRAPHRYLADVNPRIREKVLDSHVVPHHPKSAIWEPNARKAFPAFLEERRTLVMRGIEKRAGRKLFQKA